MQKSFHFDDLSKSDLVVDAIYEGGSNGNVGDDPITKMLNCGNQGGFRHKGTIDGFHLKFVALYTSLNETDWPDNLDEQTGAFVYYGDNREPGHELHDTKKKGNIILRECFHRLHYSDRNLIPPFFVFQKGAKHRDVIFRGVAVPGTKQLNPTEDLVAIWKSKNGNRFQNYRAIFTILDIHTVTREWINDLNEGNFHSACAPTAWVDWVQSGNYNAMCAERTIEHRSKVQQIPETDEGKEIIKLIYEYFKDGYSFEPCAVELVKLMDANITECDLTRFYVDGGRDATGKYRIGLAENNIAVEFALEAKRYKLDNAVTIDSTSRLISRMRHRQFGILVTTSFVHHQAYKEIKEDGHPVIIVCAVDILNILSSVGLSTKKQVESWLIRNF